MPNLNPTHIEDKVNSWKAIQEEFGSDVIVVYKPKGLNYYITTSQISPMATTEIIHDLAERMDKPAETAKSVVAKTTPPRAYKSRTTKKATLATATPVRRTRGPDRKPRSNGNGILSMAEWHRKHGTASYTSKATREAYNKYRAAQEAKRTGTVIHAAKNSARKEVGLEPLRPSNYSDISSILKPDM